MRGLKRRRAWVTSAMENGNTFYGIFAGSNSGPLSPELFAQGRSMSVDGIADYLGERAVRGLKRRQGVATAWRWWQRGRGRCWPTRRRHRRASSARYVAAVQGLGQLDG